VTIDPLVNGQQLIMSVDDEGGNAVCRSSNGDAFADDTVEDFADFCFALQHACPPIGADITAMDCAADGCESRSAIALRA
jgi:hypothetical protein